MIFNEGKIDEIETYKGFSIVIEHNLHILRNVKETEYPIYTICKLGRSFQGEINNVKKFIDDMLIEYSEDY